MPPAGRDAETNKKKEYQEKSHRASKRDNLMARVGLKAVMQVDAGGWDAQLQNVLQAPARRRLGRLSAAPGVDSLTVQP